MGLIIKCVFCLSNRLLVCVPVYFHRILAFLPWTMWHSILDMWLYSLKPSAQDIFQPSCFQRCTCVVCNKVSWLGGAQVSGAHNEWKEAPPCSLDTLTSSTYLGLRKWVQMCQVGCKIAMESLLGKEHWKKLLVKYHNTPGSRNLSSVYWRRTVKTWVPQGTWLHSRGTNITPSFPAPHHEGSHRNGVQIQLTTATLYIET